MNNTGTKDIFVSSVLGNGINQDYSNVSLIRSSQSNVGISAQEANKLLKKYHRNSTKKYGPALSEVAAVSVRRLAWAMKTNMGQAIDAMVISLPGIINQEQVCSACRDNSKCSSCIFQPGKEHPLKISDLFK